MKVSINVSQANLAYYNIWSFVLNFLVREGSSTVLTSNWVVASVVFWYMPSGILSRSASSFALTLPFRVLDLTSDIFIFHEANKDTKDLNNFGSDAISRADLLITVLILWSLLLRVSPFSLVLPLYSNIVCDWFPYIVVCGSHSGLFGVRSIYSPSDSLSSAFSGLPVGR